MKTRLFARHLLPSRALFRVAGTGVLLAIAAAPLPPAQAQPNEAASLMVPDEAAMVAVGAIAPVETAAQKAEKADLQRETRERDIWRAAWSEMGGKDGVNERQKPAETLAAYRSWIQNHAELHPSVAAEAGVAVARLQWQSGDKAGADATLGALWDKVNQSDAGLLVRAAQAGLKLDVPPEDKAKAGREAQALLDPLVARAIASARGRFVPAREMLQRCADALAAQGKSGELSEFALKVMLGAPEHLVATQQNEGGWLYRVTIETLLADARPEAPAQALSWARLSWAECSFDTQSVTDASRLVARALLAQPKGAELLFQWAKAQKDPTLANPMQEVALPRTDPKALPALLESLGEDGKGRQARVSVLLWMGRHHEAMNTAVRGADKLPDYAKGARLDVMREVARVFKAHDLNLKRANAYLGWAGNGVGASPLDAFLAEVPGGVKTR